mgnify:CR=1 FL=1
MTLAAWGYIAVFAGGIGAAVLAAAIYLYFNAGPIMPCHNTMFC